MINNFVVRLYAVIKNNEPTTYGMSKSEENSLEEIWNSKKYDEFRKMLITGNFPKEHKCLKNCDQVKLLNKIFF